jgi:hypothetical protein
MEFHGGAFWRGRGKETICFVRVLSSTIHSQPENPPGWKQEKLLCSSRSPACIRAFVTPAEGRNLLVAGAAALQQTADSSTAKAVSE